MPDVDCVLKVGVAGRWEELPCSDAKTIVLDGRFVFRGSSCVDDMVIDILREMLPTKGVGEKFKKEQRRSKRYRRKDTLFLRVFEIFR